MARELRLYDGQDAVTFDAYGWDVPAGGAVWKTHPVTPVQLAGKPYDYHVRVTASIAVLDSDVKRSLNRLVNGQDAITLSDEQDAGDKAVSAAVREGLRVHRATTHVGGLFEFVGADWESGGFHVDVEGNPTCDVQGNTVATHCVREIDTATDGDLCREWYGE